jgi:hypothetical protein
VQHHYHLLIVNHYNDLPLGDLQTELFFPSVVIVPVLIVAIQETLELSEAKKKFQI